MRDIYLFAVCDIINQAALAHLGERQTEVHFESCKINLAISGGTVFDPQKRHPLHHPRWRNW
jgi:hypothetical protein